MVTTLPFTLRTSEGFVENVGPGLIARVSQDAPGVRLCLVLKPDKGGAPLHTFPLPVATPEFTVSLLWYPRMNADSAHRWLRECLRDVCSKPSARWAQPKARKS